MKKIIMLMLCVVLLFAVNVLTGYCEQTDITVLKEFGRGEKGTNWQTACEKGVTWQDGYDIKWTPGEKLGNGIHLAAVSSYTSPFTLKELAIYNPQITVNVRYKTTSRFKFGLSFYWYADGCKSAGGVSRNAVQGDGSWQVFSIRLSQLLEFTEKTYATGISENWDKKSIYLAIDNQNPQTNGAGVFSGSASDSVYIDSWWLEGIDIEELKSHEDYVNASEKGLILVYGDNFVDETGFILDGSDTTIGEKSPGLNARIYNYGETKDITGVIFVISKDKKLKTVNFKTLSVKSGCGTDIKSDELCLDKIRIEDGDKLKVIFLSGKDTLIPLCSRELCITANENIRDERYYIYPGEKKVSFENGIAMAEAEDFRNGDCGNVLISSELLSGNKGICFKNPGGSESLIKNPLLVYNQPVVKISFDTPDDNTNYNFWIRYSATTNGSDSVYCGNDNLGYKSVFFDITDTNEYRWAFLGKGTFDAGVHTLNLTVREYNLCIDKIVISSNSSYVPTGFGNPTEVPFTEILYETDKSPKAERPRVLINKSDIAVILENATHKENISSYNAYLKYAHSEYDTDLLMQSPKYPFEAVKYIESKAFNYVASGNEENGRDAIDILIKLISQCENAVTEDYNTIGETTYLIGIVYDWCYPLLSEEEKLFLQSQVIILNSQSEIGWPPSKGSAVVSHSSEGMLMRDLLVCAIAMYEDRPDIYQNVMGRFFSEFVAPRKELYQKAGSYFMGNHYLQYRYQWELFADRIIEKAYDIRHVFGEDYGKLMYKLIYSRRPDGGILREGDSSINGVCGEYVPLGLRLMFYASSAFDDPYLKYTALKQKSTDKNGSYTFSDVSPIINQSITPVEFMIMNNPGVEAKPTEDLPLTRYFPSPYGSMIARTGWNEGISSGDAVVEMKICEYSFSEHQHLDAGAFQIYYKGALANDTGYYQQANPDKSRMEEFGNTACASLHDRNYQSRTIAHNCMLIYDPDEKHISKDNLSVDVENDGGQERKNNSENPKTYGEIIENSQSWKSGEVLGYEYGPDITEPDWTYLKGDISYAYSDKVSAYERSFMFLNLKNDEVPAALIVFDRVESSNADFKKTWLLHTMNTPTVTGSRTIATVTHSGYNGKLTLDTLAPEPDNINIDIIEGGEGDAWVNGINYYADLKAGLRNEGGGARLEISPRNPQKLDYFLNVIQVSDADKNFYKEVSKTETESHIGVIISDRVVVFAKSRDRIRDDISLSLHGDKKLYRICIADCKEGTWGLYDGDKLTGTAYATDEGGILYFEAGSGEYTVKFINGNETA